MINELQNCTNVYQQKPGGKYMEPNYEVTTPEMEENHFN